MLKYKLLQIYKIMRKEQKLKKWGSSFAVRIPKSMVDKLELSLNDSVEIKNIKSSIVIKKSDNIISGNDIINLFAPLRGSGIDLSRDKSSEIREIDL